MSSEPPDFWTSVDSPRQAFTHSSECSGWNFRTNSCPCGLRSDWEQERDWQCIALNGRGVRCRNPTYQNFPFCDRYHRDRAIAAIFEHVALNLIEGEDVEARRGGVLGRWIGRMIDHLGLEDVARDRLTEVVNPKWINQQIELREKVYDLEERLREVDPGPEDLPVPTALYRHFDADGALLYVGISKDVESRFKQHSDRAIWVQFAASHTGEWLPSRRDALTAEARAIEAERPLFNKAGAAPDRNERVKNYLIEKGAWDLLAPVA